MSGNDLNKPTPLALANEKMAIQRLIRELSHSLQPNSDGSPSDDGIKLKMVDDRWNHFEATFLGPPESPYAGGTFVVDIQIPSAYPMVPPTIKFVTPIWHANVSPYNGSMCDEFLLDWAAAFTIRSLMLFVQSLLSKPDLDRPIFPPALQFIKDERSFVKVAKYWTARFASGEGEKRKENEEFDARVDTFASLVNCTPFNALVKLSSHNWNFNDAAEDIRRPPPRSPQKPTPLAPAQKSVVGLSSVDVEIPNAISIISDSDDENVPHSALSWSSGGSESDNNFGSEGESQEIESMHEDSQVEVEEINSNVGNGSNSREGAGQVEIQRMDGDNRIDREILFRIGRSTEDIVRSILESYSNEHNEYE